MIRNTIEDILHKIIPGISERLGVNQNEVHPKTTFTEDLGCDSLDAVELLMEAEKEFRIQLGDDVFAKINTVEDAAEVILNAIEVRDLSEKAKREREAKEWAELQPLLDRYEKEELQTGMEYVQRTGFPYFTHDGKAGEEFYDSIHMQMNDARVQGSWDSIALNLASIALGREVCVVDESLAAELLAMCLSSRIEVNHYYRGLSNDVRYKNGSHNVVFVNGTISDTRLVYAAADASFCDILTIAIRKRHRDISFPVTYYPKTGHNITEMYVFDRVSYFDQDNHTVFFLGQSTNTQTGKTRDVTLAVQLESGELSRAMAHKHQKAVPADKASERKYRKLYIFLSKIWFEGQKAFLKERMSFCFGIQNEPINLRTYAKILKYNFGSIHYEKNLFTLVDGRERPSFYMTTDSYRCLSLIQKLSLTKKAYAIDVLDGARRKVFHPLDIIAHSDDLLVLKGELYNPDDYSSRGIAVKWDTDTSHLYEVNPESLYRLRRDEEPLVIIGNESTRKSVNNLREYLETRLQLTLKEKMKSRLI